MDPNSFLNFVVAIAKNPWFTALAGFAAGCTVRPYFTKFFEEMGKSHAARLTRNRELRDAERQQRALDEEGLDILEDELRVLVHRSEDSLLDKRYFRQDYGTALFNIKQFFEPHHRIQALPENRQFVNAFCTLTFLTKVGTAYVAPDDVDRSIAAARQLRIRKDRPISEIE
jgi:hypothetical protein